MGCAAVRRFGVLCVAVVLTGTACGSGGSRPTATFPTAPPRSAVSGVAPPTTLGGIPGSAARQACLEDARVAQQASDTFQAKNGHPAASVDALVADGELRSAPSNAHGYVISYDAGNGKVTATGACEVP